MIAGRQNYGRDCEATGKITYPDEMSAMINAGIYAAEAGVREDRYVFPCDHCHGWHASGGSGPHGQYGSRVPRHDT